MNIASVFLSNGQCESLSGQGTNEFQAGRNEFQVAMPRLSMVKFAAAQEEK